jgi:hypothetical protein
MPKTILNTVKERYGSKAQDRVIVENMSTEFSDYSTAELKTMLELLSEKSFNKIMKHLDKKVAEEKANNWNLDVYDQQTMLVRHGKKNYALGIEWVKDLKFRIEEQLEERKKEQLESK